jgi:putative phage repressor
MNLYVDSDFKISSVFQERLSELVTDSEYNKSDLPSLIGISKDILIRAVNIGMFPSTKSLCKIADYFSVSLDYLMGITDNDSYIKAEESQTFRQRIKELKKEKGVSYCKIANTLGFARSLFNSWNTYNYIPSLELIYMLAQYFNVTIDYLLGRTDER